MYIVKSEITVHLDADEVSEIAYALSRSIENTIETHWCNWTEDKTNEEFVKYVIDKEGREYELLESFAGLINRPWMLKKIQDKIEEVYLKNVGK
jgi:hypothetical protein